MYIIICFYKRYLFLLLFGLLSNNFQSYRIISGKKIKTRIFGRSEVTRSGALHLSPALNAIAQKAYVLPHVRASLISLGQLADNDCSILLEKHKLVMFPNFKYILTGSVTNRMDLGYPTTQTPTCTSPSMECHYTRTAKFIGINSIFMPHFLAQLHPRLSKPSPMGT